MTNMTLHCRRSVITIKCYEIWYYGGMTKMGKERVTLQFIDNSDADFTIYDNVSVDSEEEIYGCTVLELKKTKCMTFMGMCFHV